MISSKLYRANLVRLLVALALSVSLFVPSGFCQDTEDSQIFIAGFNAYQNQDFATTIAKMDEMLKKYPKTPLRDMVLFWLARAHYKSGHSQDAARTMSQFSREYPDSPLKSTAEEELLTLAARYDRGEKIPASEPAVKESAVHKAQTEQERVAAEKTEKERVAEAARLTRLKAEQERIAAKKAEQQRLADEKAEQKRSAAALAEQQRLNEQRLTGKKVRMSKAQLREKAVEQYKLVIQNYPNTKAATVAAAKLRDMGITVAATPSKPTGTDSQQAENTQIFRLEVVQLASFELKLPAAPQIYDVGRRIAIPFEITNQSNGNDAFNLESGFPGTFNSGFTSANAPEQTITRTPLLAPDETFKGIVHLTIPAACTDGLRITHPIKAASQFMGEASQSREIHLTAAAPFLRAIVKTEKNQPVPGEKIPYRVVLLNVGSIVAQNVSLRLNFPPQLEPLANTSASLKENGQSTLVFDNLQLKPGESRELPVDFRLKDDSLAGQELFCHAELLNNQLKTSTTFVSNVAHVKPVHGVLVRSVAERIVIIPGQTVNATFVVTNTGNVREKFRIIPEIKGAEDTIVFHDLNRDGIKQANEPLISEIGPLEPKEEASIVMEIKTSRNTTDASEGSARITFSPEGDAAKSASGLSGLIYSRPVLKMAMTSSNGRLKPGDVASFDLSITNRGSNLARAVDLQSTWPEQLEFVAAEPVKSSISNGKILWKFKELGAGEKRIIKVSFRVKQGIGVGTSIQVTNTLNYEDQLGNRY